MFVYSMSRCTYSFGSARKHTATTFVLPQTQSARAAAAGLTALVAPTSVAAAAPESVAPMRRRGGADRRRDSPCSGTVHPRAAPSAGESLPCLASSDAARPACPQNPADGGGEATATQSTSSSPRSQHCRRRAGAAAGKRRPLAPSIFFCGPRFFLTSHGARSPAAVGVPRARLRGHGMDDTADWRPPGPHHGRGRACPAAARSRWDEGCPTAPPLQARSGRAARCRPGPPGPAPPPGRAGAHAHAGSALAA